MIKPEEDMLDIDFVLDVIGKEDWVNEEVLLIYESCYRRLKSLAHELELDTTEMDNAHERVMKLYGQV